MEYDMIKGIGPLLGFLGVIGIGVWVANRRSNASSTRLSSTSQDLSSLAGTARERERVKHGGMTNAQLHTLLATLEETQSIGSPAPKFNGRETKSRKKG